MIPKQITREKFTEILSTAPAGTTKENLYDFLKSKGHTFVADEAIAAEPVVENDVTSTPEQPGRLSRVGSAAMSALEVPQDVTKGILRETGKAGTNLFDLGIEGIAKGVGAIAGQDAGDIVRKAKASDLTRASGEEITAPEVLPRGVQDFIGDAAKWGIINSAMGPIGQLAGTAAEAAGAGRILEGVMKVGSRAVGTGLLGAATGDEGNREQEGITAGLIEGATGAIGEGLSSIKGFLNKIKGLDDKTKKYIDPLFATKEAAVAKNALGDPEGRKILETAMKDVENYNLEPGSKTAFANAGKEVEDVYKRIRKLMTDRGKEQGEALSQQAAQAIDDVSLGGKGAKGKVDAVIDTIKDEISSRFNVSFGPKGIREIPGRKSLLNESDAAEIISLLSDLNAAKKANSLGYLVDTIKAIDDKIDYSLRPNTLRPISGPMEGVMRRGRKLLADVRDAVADGTPYAEKLASTREIQWAADFMEKIGGGGAERGLLTLRRMLAENNSDALDFANIVKKLTGIDLERRAALTKFATDVMGNQQARSLFTQTIQGGGSMTGKAVDFTIKKLTDLLANPMSEAMRIAGKKTLRSLVEDVVSKGAPPIVLSSVENIVDWLDSWE